MNLSVADLVVYFVMTTLAKAHQIASVMSAALRDGNLVVYLFHRNKDALLEAPLAERMRLDITVTNSFPCSAVFFMHLRVTTLLLVVLLHQLAMLFAVSAIRQIRTAWVSTGLFRFSWHRLTSLSA